MRNDGFTLIELLVIIAIIAILAAAAIPQINKALEGNDEPKKEKTEGNFYND